MNTLLKKLIYVIFFIILSFFILSYNSFKKSILNNHFELRNIELIISSDINYVHLLNKKINQYGDLVQYSYVDNSNDVLVYNTLKKKSIDELYLYQSLLAESSIEYLFNSLNNFQWSNENYLQYQNILNELIDVLYKYVNDRTIDKEIGLKLLNKLMNIDNFNHSKNHKIIIKSNKVYSNHFSFIHDYRKFYEFLNNISNPNINIESMQFYDNFLFGMFTDSNSSIESKNSQCILCYSSTINDLEDSIDKLNRLDIEFKSKTILDFIITNNIDGQKYKLINKILINSSNYSVFQKMSIDEFFDNLVDMENIIIDLERFNNDLTDSLFKIKVIIDFFKNNKDNYSYYYNLADSYYKILPNYISNIANTEKYAEDKLSLFILNDFKRSGVYVSRFFLQDENLSVFKTSFNFNTSDD